MRRSLFVFVALFVAACSTPDAPPSSQRSPVDFAPEPSGDGPAVFVRGRPDTLGDRVLVDVVARGALDVHGAAFRLRFDPAMLAYSEIAPGVQWHSGAMAVAKEGTPGQLAVVFAEKGGIGIVAKDETILGTLTFDVKKHGPTALSFRADRSGVVDRDGNPVAVTWHGGTLTTH